MAATLDIRNFTRGPAPRLPFEEALERTLPGWDLSLVFVGETRAKKLNQTLRNKEYTPNVLSYATGKKSGEIIICPAVAKRQASAYGLGASDFILYLFIHGALHLKGLRHGATMDRYEREALARMKKALPTKSNGSTHRNRNRYRNAPNESRRRRGS